MKKGFFSQVMMIFFVSLLSSSVIGLVFGDGAKEFSTLFSLGNQGLSFLTIFQFFLTSIVIALLKEFFFSEKIIKKMRTAWRASLLVLSVFIFVILCIIGFKWFPVDYLPAWIGFFVSFGVCFGISTVFMIIKTKLDSKRYTQLLINYKKTNQEKEAKKL